MQLLSLVRRRRQELLFLTVGGIATVVDIVLFNVLHTGARLDPLLAKTVSTAASAVVAFVGNRQWSFAGYGGAATSGLRGQVLRYVAATLASLLIALVPIEVCRTALGLHGVVAMNIAANVVGLGLAMVFRFYAYREWVFADLHQVPPVPVAARG